MGTIAGIIATFAAAHLGGHLAGGTLARYGLMGFGKAIKARRARAAKERRERERKENLNWIAEALKKEQPK